MFLGAIANDAFSSTSTYLLLVYIKYHQCLYIGFINFVYFAFCINPIDF